MFDLQAAWRLHPQVALRPEPFGALLYHFDPRDSAEERPLDDT